MSDSYQAVYDAACQKIGRFDGHALAREISNQFGDAYLITQEARQSVEIVSSEMQRPSVLFRPRVYMDGNKWCALYGENIQEGVCGFGDTPDEAARAFDAAWNGAA